jgi:hypothetical protein
MWQYNEIAPPTPKEKKINKSTTKIGGKKMLAKSRNYPKFLKTIKFSFFLRFLKNKPPKINP